MKKTQNFIARQNEMLETTGKSPDKKSIGSNLSNRSFGKLSDNSKSPTKIKSVSQSGPHPKGNSS